MLEEEAVYHVVCPHCGTHEDDTIKPILAADLRKIVTEMRHYADRWAAWDKAEIVAKFAEELELLLKRGE